MPKNQTCATILPKQEGVPNISDEKERVYRRKNTKNMRRRKWRIRILIALGIIVILAIFNLTFSFVDLSTPTMSPTIEPGESCFVSIISYACSEPDYDDIALFQMQLFGNENGRDRHISQKSIARIVGLPGDEIEFKDNILYVNGTLNRRYANVQGEDEGQQYYKIHIPENSYFLLGDNTAAFDSRYYGCISRSDIKGKVLGHFHRKHLFQKK